MQGVARTGDTVSGVCSAPGHIASRPFTGVWSSTHGLVTADGLGVILTGDTGSTTCGHTFRATTGSSSAIALGLAMHRQGDAINIVEGPGSGTTVTGSSVVTSA
jgi:hypothetical protein